MAKKPCPHCRQKDTIGGTHNGCSNCGKVKHTKDGKRRK